LDVLEKLEQSIWHFEHFKALILALLANNIKDQLEARPGDVAQERGELLYHLLCYVFIVHCYLLVIICILNVKVSLTYVFAN
jgi:hypothetical protein